MIAPAEWNVISARRTLLRQQAALIGPRLPWLLDPAVIPDDAIASSIAQDDIPLAAFSLAGWMLIEILQAANRTSEQLDWERAFARFQVAPQFQDPLVRAIISPASRYAPGLFAMAEIVGAIPKVARRAGVPRHRWHEIARRAKAFGAQLACDNTSVQVLLRSYISRSDTSDKSCNIRTLNPAWLRLDEASGLTTTTPIATLLAAARDVSARRGHSYQAPCVALQASAPQAFDGTAADNMFGAIWISFAHAADRLVFPRFDNCRDPIPPEAAEDPGCAATLDELAARRSETLKGMASRPYPEAVEQILGMLLKSARPS